MDKVLLISVETLKKQSLLGANLDGVYIYPCIVLAQDLDLTNIIGPALVNKLCNLVASGEIDTSTDYKFLLDNYVTNYLVWSVSYNLIPAINYKLQNAGVSTATDTQRQTLDYNSSKNLAEQMKNYSDAYATKMRDYLCHNSAKFPEYHQFVNCEGAQAPQRCGIVFDDDHNCCDYLYK